MLRPPSNDDGPPLASQPLGAAEDARIARLAEEYRRLAGAFVFHPAINVIPVSGDPPAAYQVEFRVRTVTFEMAERKLHYVDNVALVLTLDASYPNSPPRVQPPEGLFLPNADDDELRIDGAWRDGDWLVDLLPKLGELLAYRTYDPDSVLNADALEWQEANVSVLPTDKSADFSASAGGSPAERIQRHSAARLSEVRRVLEATLQRLADGEIDPDAVRDTAAQAKYVLLPLLQEAGDPAVIASAKELTAWVDSLADSLPGWEELRDRRTLLASAQRERDAIAAATKRLTDALAELSAMFTGTPPSRASKALGQIPSAAVLAPLVPGLSGALAEARQRETQARKALADFADFDASHPPADPVTPATASPFGDSPVKVLLADRQSAVAADCAQYAALAGPGLEQLAELVRGGRAEIAALRRLADWRDYLDQFISATDLAREVLEQGPKGVQAYTLESLGQIMGPYQFEQVATFGQMQLAVGRYGDTLQIVDASTSDIVGSRAASSIALRIPIQGGQATVTVRASGDCAAIAARLDSARTRTFESLSRLHERVPESQSWCGRLLAVLSDPAALAAIHAEHRRSAHRWDRLAADLLLLAPLKDRLATFYLVRRITSSVSDLAQKRAAAGKMLAAANERLAALAARCERDPDSEKLLIPPKLATAYGQATTDRELSNKDIRRIDRRERALSDQMGKRLIEASRIGRADVPSFRRLGALPQELAEAAGLASDGALSAAVSALSGQLRVTFPPVVASEPVDLSSRRREKRSSDAPDTSPSEPIDADQALALRPEDSMADVIAIVEGMESEGE
jgi:ubiquitin-protein ligase